MSRPVAAARKRLIAAQMLQHHILCRLPAREMCAHIAVHRKQVIRFRQREHRTHRRRLVPPARKRPAHNLALIIQTKDRFLEDTRLEHETK